LRRPPAKGEELRRLPPKGEELIREAVNCRECFRLREVKDPFISVAQPRSIGPRYWASSLRVVVLMLNPGQSRASTAARGFLDNIGLFRDGRMDIQEIFRGQREVMPSWGNGRFGAFYLDGLGLTLDEIAFVNVAWCATAGNEYPGSMLRRCFAAHTAISPTRFSSWVSSSVSNQCSVDVSAAPRSQIFGNPIRRNVGSAASRSAPLRSL
jgi:hypothetical protein